MTLRTKVIGRQPTDHGPYDPNLAYGEKFQCTLFGCSWESKNDNNTTAPAVWDGGDTITPNLVDWKKVSGSYESWLLSVNKPATTGYTGDYPYNGMGRVKLVKNMVNTGTDLEPVMVNTLTQDMFYKGAVGSRVPNTNTIFVIQYDYVLAENITIPDGCVLQFDGGSVKNGTGNSYYINGKGSTFNYTAGYSIFNNVLPKYFDIPYIDIRWFGAVSGLVETATNVYTGIDCHDAFVMAFETSCYYQNKSIKLIGNFYLAETIDLTARKNYNIAIEGTYYSSGSYVQGVTLPNLYVAGGITAIKTGGQSGSISVDGVAGSTLGAGLAIRNLSVYGNGNGIFLDYYWVGAPVRHGYIVGSVISQFNKCISVCVKKDMTSFSTISHLTITQCQIIGTYAIFSENENLTQTTNETVRTYLSRCILYNPYGALDDTIIEQNKILGKIHIDTPNGPVRISYNSLESSTDCIYIRTTLPLEIIGNQFEGMHGDYIANITGLYEQIGQPQNYPSENPRNIVPGFTIKNNYYCEGTWGDVNLPFLLYGYIYQPDIKNNTNIRFINYAFNNFVLGKKSTYDNLFITPIGCIKKYKSDLYISSNNKMNLIEDDGIGCVYVNSDNYNDEFGKIKLDVVNGGTNQVVVFMIKFIENGHFVLSATSNNGASTLPGRFYKLDNNHFEINRWYTLFMLIKDIPSNENEYFYLSVQGHYLLSTPTIFGFGNTTTIDMSKLAYFDNKPVGSTAVRNALTSLYAGFEYFDTDLGKMVVYNGSAWRNVDGSAL